MTGPETLQRIEPVRLKDFGEATGDVVATGLLASDASKRAVLPRLPWDALRRQATGGDTSGDRQCC